MSQPMLERDDLSVYVVSGVPKSFKKRLARFLEGESKGEGELLMLDDELTEWLVARLRGEKTRSHEETPASAALWRAYRALSAARYHVQEEAELERLIRSLRSEVEILWERTRPKALLSQEEEAEEEAGVAE